VNQEESEQNEVDGIKKGADTTDKLMHRDKRRGGNGGGRRDRINREQDTDAISSTFNGRN